MIPYIGSKNTISNFITENIPTDISTYVEPFGGMFSIFFSLDTSKPITFVYNDINYYNYNLFNHLQSDTFIEYISNISVDEQFYTNSQKTISNASDIDKALYWLVILTCSMSQVDVMNGTWKNDGKFELIKMRLSKRNIFKRIDSIHNSDYKDIFSQYDSKDTFFYLDPPYYKKESYYINHDFNKDSNHHELSEVLKSIKGKFALSYYDFPQLNEWYSQYNKKTHRTSMGLEILIMNY